MKKLLVAIFAFFYIGTSIGATVQLHYCMGKLADWGIGHKASKTCDKCGMEKSEKKDKGCCKDDHKFFKNIADQQATESAFQLMQSIAIALPVSFFELPPVHTSSLTEENPISHAPPQSGGITVYIRNCVFLI